MCKGSGEWAPEPEVLPLLASYPYCYPQVWAYCLLASGFIPRWKPALQVATLLHALWLKDEWAVQKHGTEKRVWKNWRVARSRHSSCRSAAPDCLSTSLCQHEAGQVPSNQGCAALRGNGGWSKSRQKDPICQVVLYYTASKLTSAWLCSDISTTAMRLEDCLAKNVGPSLVWTCCTDTFLVSLWINIEWYIWEEKAVLPHAENSGLTTVMKEHSHGL